jgi:transcriptional antiterminator NusG
MTVDEPTQTNDAAASDEDAPAEEAQRPTPEEVVPPMGGGEDEPGAAAETEPSMPSEDVEEGEQPQPEGVGASPEVAQAASAEAGPEREPEPEGDSAGSIEELAEEGEAAMEQVDLPEQEGPVQTVEPPPPVEPEAAELEDGLTGEVAPSAEAAEAAASPDGEQAPVAPATVAEEDPFGGAGDWYVIHTYAGYENKVKTNLESRIHTMQMEDKIFDVVIPMEDVMEIKGGKKQVVQKKVFPGYLLVKMVYDDDSWYVVRNTPGVTGFVSSGTGQKPTPLSRREVEKILVVKKEEVKPTFRLDFEEGDVVRIISGPFADFNGTISEINMDQSKVKVMVNIFDRETPVELSFDDVARV